LTALERYCAQAKPLNLASATAKKRAGAIKSARAHLINFTRYTRQILILRSRYERIRMPVSPLQTLAFSLISHRYLRSDKPRRSDIYRLKFHKRC